MDQFSQLLIEKNNINEYMSKITLERDDIYKKCLECSSLSRNCETNMLNIKVLIRDINSKRVHKENTLKLLEVETLHNRIEYYQSLLDKFDEEISMYESSLELSKKLDSKEVLEEKYKLFSDQMKGLDVEITKVNEDIDRLNILISKEDMRSKYLKYATDNGVVYTDENSLFRECNIHRNLVLSKGYTVTKKGCFDYSSVILGKEKVNHSCNSTYCLDVDMKTKTVKGSCECQQNKWIVDNIDEYTLNFNIESVLPRGHNSFMFETLTDDYDPF